MSRKTIKKSDEQADIVLDHIKRWAIPQNWVWTTIDIVGSIVTGNTPSTKNRANYGTDIPFVKPPVLLDSSIYNAPEGLSKQGAESARVLPTDSVLVSCIGNLGKTGISKVPVAFNQQINAIKFSDDVIPKFGFYYAQTLKNWLYNVFSATTLPIVNKGKFQKAPIPIAPLNEQKRIVEEIEKQFSRLDEAVENLKRVKANLKRYKASVLKAAVEGKLTEEWRKKHSDVEPADKLLKRILVERRKKWEESELAKMKAKGKVPKDNKWKNKYKEPIEPSWDEYPSLPEHWCWATIEQLASDQPRSIQSGPFGSNLLHSEFQKEGKLVVGIDNVQDGYFSKGSQNRISNAKFKELEKYAARPGDVLITVMATVGRTCVIPENIEPAIITKHIYRIAPNRRIVIPDFLHLAIWGGAFVREQIFGQVIGQTRPGLNGTIIRRLVIPIPTLQEQSLIVKAIDEKRSLLDKLIPEMEKVERRSERLRQSILKKAFQVNWFLKTIMMNPKKIR